MLGVDGADEGEDVLLGAGGLGGLGGMVDEGEHVFQVVLEGGFGVLGEPLGGEVVGGDAGEGLAVDVEGEGEEEGGQARRVTMP